MRKNFRQRESLWRQYQAPKVFNEQKKLLSGLNNFKVNLKTLFLIGLLIWVWWLVFNSSYFKITDILVEGNSAVTTERVRASIKEGQNILFFSADKAKERLLVDCPEIKDAVIYRGIPNALKIVVLEHDGALVWESGGTAFLISSAGIVAKKIEPSEMTNYTQMPRILDLKNLPVVIGQQLVSGNFVSFTKNIFAGMPESVNLKAAHAAVEETTFDLSVYTDAGFFIRLNTVRSSRRQLENLRAVLAEKKSDIHEYVDLRIDGWAYYK